MEQYISKSAVVAEIEDWRDKIKKGIFSIPLSGKEKAYATFEYEVLGKVLLFLDTLKVKEVDLDEDVDRILEEYDWQYDKIDFYEFAKHFFKLGMQQSKN